MCTEGESCETGEDEKGLLENEMDQVGGDQIKKGCGK